ncbi:pirin family protein [Agarivorans sp. Z349TD_8]|uniref:pirin family protein n=1 Tax=Agarivorans sp. Z349TD_8 TaxID=3421434 RepID=UPI003D7D5F17
MFTKRAANQRGRANFGWLDSQHSFSFGQYYDPQQMGFSALRVINDDVVSAGAGFATHPHRDMEIISYVLEGCIQHKDSEGNMQNLPAGEFQLMSAGRGIYHSEFNASATEPLHFLQIWIEPDIFGKQPGYQQKNFGQEPGLTTVLTPTGEQGSLQIKQDARLHQLILEPQHKLSFSIQAGRRLYVHQITGHLMVDQLSLQAGDGLKVENLEHLEFINNGEQRVLALLFDLP